MNSPLILASCAAFAGELPSGGGFEQHPNVDHRFPDGEAFVELSGSVPDAVVVIFQTLTRADAAPDEALMSLLATVRAYKEYGAAEAHVVVPHLAYSRQDRRIPGEMRPVMARLVADLLVESGADAIAAVAAGAQDRLDLHYRGRLRQIETDSFVLNCLRRVSEEAVLVAPDAGAGLRVERLARLTGRDWLVLDKQRTSPEDVLTSLRSGDAFPESRRELVVIDDLISSGGTIESALRTLNTGQRIPRSTTIVAPHLQLGAAGLSRLAQLHEHGFLERVIGLDTVPVRQGAAYPPFMCIESWLQHCDPLRALGLRPDGNSSLLLQGAVRD